MRRPPRRYRAAPAASRPTEPLTCQRCSSGLILQHFLNPSRHKFVHAGQVAGDCILEIVPGLCLGPARGYTSRQRRATRHESSALRLSYPYAKFHLAPLFPALPDMSSIRSLRGSCFQRLQIIATASSRFPAHPCPPPGKVPVTPRREPRTPTVLREETGQKPAISPPTVGKEYCDFFEREYDSRNAKAIVPPPRSAFQPKKRALKAPPRRGAPQSTPSKELERPLSARNLGKIFRLRRLRPRPGGQAPPAGSAARQPGRRFARNPRAGNALDP